MNHEIFRVGVYTSGRAGVDFDVCAMIGMVEFEIGFLWLGFWVYLSPYVKV